MQALLDFLVSGGWLSLREVLRLLLLSGLFTLACVMAFPRNAPTRRMLLLAAVTLLLVLPWVLASVDAVWHVAMERLPEWSLSQAIPNALIVLWAVVAAWLIGRHLLTVRREIESIHALPLETAPPLMRIVSELADRLDLKTPDVRVGDCACSTSIRRPVIVLPVNWHEWDDVTLTSVLAHELIHIERRDDRWLLATRCLVLGYWWMPWLIWLYRVYVRVMEESCDDAASELVGHDLSYLGGLVRAADAARTPVTGYQSVANMHVHHLVGRVGRFGSDRVLELDTRGIYWWVMGILALVTGLTGIEPVKKHTYVVIQGRPDYPLARTIRTNADVVIPRVTSHTSLPTGLNAAQRERLLYPEHAPVVIYPGSAINAQIEGEVVVEHLVNRSGAAVEARVVTGSGRAELDRAALRAAQGTRYLPTYAETSVTPLHAGQSSVADYRRRDNKLTQEPHNSSIRVRRHFRFRLDAG